MTRIRTDDRNMNKIFINGKLGAVFKDDELKTVYDNITDLSYWIDSLGDKYLQVTYEYQDLLEDQEVWEENTIEYWDTISSTDLYKVADYEIDIKNRVEEVVILD